MSNLIKAGAAALVAATLVLTGAGAASAEQTTVDDRKGDVWLKRSGFARAGSPLNADIDRTAVDHGVDSLVVTTTYERLARKGRSFYTYWRVRTDSGAVYEAFVVAGRGAWRGEPYFSEDTAQPTRGVPALRRGVQCQVAHDIDYRADTVTMTIPRPCLADPQALQVKSLSVAFNDSQEKLWLDNGHIPGHRARGWTSPLAAGDPTP